MRHECIRERLAILQIMFNAKMAALYHTDDYGVKLFLHVNHVEVLGENTTLSFTYITYTKNTPVH